MDHESKANSLNTRFSQDTTAENKAQKHFAKTGNFGPTKIHKPLVESLTNPNCHPFQRRLLGFKTIKTRFIPWRFGIPPTWLDPEQGRPILVPKPELLFREVKSLNSSLCKNSSMGIGKEMSDTVFFVGRWNHWFLRIWLAMVMNESCEPRFFQVSRFLANALWPTTGRCCKPNLVKIITTEICSKDFPQVMKIGGCHEPFGVSQTNMAKKTGWYFGGGLRRLMQRPLTVFSPSNQVC